MKAEFRPTTVQRILLVAGTVFEGRLVKGIGFGVGKLGVQAPDGGCLAMIRFLSSNKIDLVITGYWQIPRGYGPRSSLLSTVPAHRASGVE